MNLPLDLDDQQAAVYLELLEQLIDQLIEHYLALQRLHDPGPPDDWPADIPF